MRSVRSPPIEILQEFLTPFAGFTPSDYRFDPPHDPGFSGAAVWRVTAANEVWCLKGFPRGEIELERQFGLHRLLRHLRNQGVLQIATPLAGRNGSTLHEAIGRLWQLEPWLPGEPESEPIASPARIAAALASLAAWHRAARTYPALDRDSSWFRSGESEPAPGVAERLSVLSRWNESDLRELERRVEGICDPQIVAPAQVILRTMHNAAELLRRELEAAMVWQTSIQPCLRDVWRPHILFQGDRVTGIVDPQACRRDSVACDIARLLGSLCGSQTAGWILGLRMYDEVRSLSDVERLLVRVYDRSGCLLSGLWWVEKFARREVERPESPSLAARALQRLSHFAARLGDGLPECGLG